MAVQIEVPLALAQQLAAAGQPAQASVTGLGLIDTGATISAVDASVISKLGVNPVGIANVGTASGPQQQYVYPIRIVLTQLGLAIDYSQVTGANLSGQNLVALLGRDFLQNILLIYDGPSGEFTISF